MVLPLFFNSLIIPAASMIRKAEKSKRKKEEVKQSCFCFKFAKALQFQICQ